MKRPFSIDNEGRAFLCHYCRRIYDTGGLPEATALHGLIHVATMHAQAWLEDSHWVLGSGHVRKWREGD